MGKFLITNIEIIETDIKEQSLILLFEGYKTNIQKYHIYKGVHIGLSRKCLTEANKYKKEIIRRGYSSKAFTGNLRHLVKELGIEYIFNK